MFKYSQLQGVIANLKLSDPQMFRSIGLIPLSKIYNAYPVTVEGTKLCVLIPQDMMPNGIARLDEKTAAEKRIVVLKKEMNNPKWQKIWPEKQATVEIRPTVENGEVKIEEE